MLVPYLEEMPPQVQTSVYSAVLSGLGLYAYIEKDDFEDFLEEEYSELYEWYQDLTEEEQHSFFKDLKSTAKRLEGILEKKERTFEKKLEEVI